MPDFLLFISVPGALDYIPTTFLYDNINLITFATTLFPNKITSEGQVFRSWNDTIQPITELKNTFPQMLSKSHCVKLWIVYEMG